MNKIASVFFFIFIFIYLINVNAQKTKVINGKVLDSIGVPISGATISYHKSKNEVITNDSGLFTLNIPSNIREIVINRIGYVGKRISVNDIDTLRIILDHTKGTLNDVVVIGSQTYSRKLLTAAVSSISGDAIQNLPSASVDQLLQGRIAGLNVQVFSGEPGVAASVVVRGNSRVNTNIGNVETAQTLAMSGPLYIIDGVPTNPEDILNNTPAGTSTGSGYLAGINVNDIESVDVQKDAAATAAWGSRGANGVIYIKTRRGRSPIPEFGINAYTGFVKIPKLLKTYTGAEERRAKVDILRQYGTNTQINNLPQLLSDSLNPYFNSNTNWQGMFYKSAFINNVDATVSAATESINYRVSLNYFNQDGVIRSTGFNRYSLRGNFNFKISPRLNTQLIFSAVKGNMRRGKKLYNSDNNTPVSGPEQPSSFYLLSAFDSSNLLGVSVRNQNITDNYMASFTLNYNITKDFHYSFLGSATVNNSSKDYFEPSNGVSTQLNPLANPILSYAESDRNSYSTYYFSNTINYTKKITTENNKAHNFSFTGVQRFTSDVANGNSVSGNNVPSNDIKVVTGIPQSDLSGSSYYRKDALVSLLGQLQYDYNSKYIVYGSVTRDGSSRFGNNSKWGTFSSIGGAWILTEENFMKRISNVVNFLKIRGSWGVSGNQNGDFYAPYNNYIIPGTYGGNTAIQPSFTNGLTKDNLTWARTVQKSIGLDAQLLRNRITFSLDVYDKISKDDYNTFNLPFFTGYNSIQFNAHDLWVSNRGVDVTINTHNLSPRSSFQWNTQLVLSFNKNIIAKLPNNNRTFFADDGYGVTRMYSVGQPIYQMFQVHYMGVYNQASEIPVNPNTGQGLTYFKGNHIVVPGDPIWYDANKDYDVWTDKSNGDKYGDRIPTGNPNPKVTGGFTNDFSYKNFSLSITSVFTWKRTVVNTFLQQQMVQLIGYGGIQQFARIRLPNIEGINYWTPAKALDPNYQAEFPSINPFTTGFYPFMPWTDMFNVDGSYFKVKYVTLGYLFQPSVIKKLGIKGARVFAMADNIWIVKNKKNTMPDPELVDATGIYTGGLYPQARTITVGVNVQF